MTHSTSLTRSPATHSPIHLPEQELLGITNGGEEENLRLVKNWDAR